ncbi:hypothetical protein [Kordiimonas gwangyangensis]|uniref:hypothetical protein n=1 Tax=Kordiimonas gwangyangensis TaxID=288022 RepID=UPI00037894BD|nr:hypothetical protein [Kordiimonas gwangyangensis]
MPFKLSAVFIALFSAFFSTSAFAAFQIPELCRAATVDFAKYDRNPLELPACAKNKNCNNKDAEAIADWFDAAAKEASDRLYSLPDYYAGDTQNKLCTELIAIYGRVGQFKFVDLSKLTPTRQQMVGEAVKFMAETTDRGYARIGMSRAERGQAARADRPLLEARRKEAAEAKARAKAEDAEAKAKAQADAKAKLDAEAGAFEEKVTAALFSGIEVGFTVSKGTGRTIFRPEQGETFADAIMYAFAAWHENTANRAAADAFKPPVKDEFETTAQHAARVAAAKTAYDETHKDDGTPDYTDLDDYIAASTGGFDARNISYNADRQVFTAEIVTGNGLAAARVEIPVPLADARAAKPVLEAADLVLAFSIDPGAQTVSLKRAAFVSLDEKQPTKSAFYRANLSGQDFAMAKDRVASWHRLFEEKRSTIATQRAAEAQAERERVAELYPYRARFSCNIGALYVCLGRDGGINVRSGTEIKYYSAQDVAGRDYLDVFLMHDFEIGAETSSRAGLRMTLEITDYVNGKTLYREEAASPSGVIRVSD